jgi:hypothetical protein
VHIWAAQAQPWRYARTPKPTSARAVKQVLLNAKSIAMNPTDKWPFNRLIEMGIAERSNRRWC